ncbi:MAG: hypothetical protein RIE59_05005 [Imperialibacter sp.]
MHKNVPAEVEIYVNSFIDEAELLGHDFSDVRRNLTVEFTDLPDNKGGSSKSTFFGNHIKLAPLIWKQMNDRQREMLVFHELGHCVLGRKHKNETLLLGECASIMKEGGENTCVADIYSESWRSYYIDELFDPDVQVPDWYRVQNLADLKVIDTVARMEDSLMYASSQAKYYGINAALPLNNAVDDYLLTLEYDSVNARYGFGLNGLTISLIPETGEFSVSHVGQLDWMTYSFCAEKILPEIPLRFSMLKLGAFYHFYVNEEEKHMMNTHYFQTDTMKQPENMYFATYGGSSPTAKLTVVRISN